MRSNKIENLTDDEINHIAKLLRDDLRETERAADTASDTERLVLANKWDLYMLVLKQSTMPGCVSGDNPYR